MSIACPVERIEAQVGRPDGEAKRLSPRSDELAMRARAFGAKVYEVEGGKVFATFPVGRQHVPVTWPNRQSAERGIAYLTDLKRSEAEIARKVGRQAQAVKLDVPEKPFSVGDVDQTMRLDQLMHGEVDAALHDPWRYITGKAAVDIGKAATVRGGLNRMGEAGQALADMFGRRNDIKDRLLGKWLGQVERILAPLNEEEIANGLRRHRELGAPASPAVQAASQELSQVFQQIADTALEVGLDVPRLFNSAKYWPHKHDMVMLRDQEKANHIADAMVKSGKAPDREAAFATLEREGYGTSRDRAIRKLMDGKQLAHIKDSDERMGAAAYILDNYIKKAGAKRSTHLEHDRLSDLEPIEHARRALSSYFFDVADRLSTVQTLGVGNGYARKMIGQIRRDQGDRSAKFAEDVLRMETSVSESRLEGFFRYAYDWQANKLSLSVLANATQPLNAAMRVGFGNFLKALKLYATEDIGTKGQHAKDIGAISHDILDELQQRGPGMLFEHAEGRSTFRKIFDQSIKYSLSIFNLVETMNRSISARAGEVFFSQLVRDLRSAPDNALFGRRLRDLGFDPKAILAAGDSDLTEMSYIAGKRISDQTQFRPNTQARPLWATSSEVGRFIYQFKSFALGQSQLVMNELNYRNHGDVQRTVRTLATLLTAFPAVGVALTESRSLLMGDTLSSKTLDKAYKDPTTMNILKAGAVAMAMAGSMGIVADVAVTAAVGNKFALTAFTTIPVFSTAVNAFDIAGSVARGVYSQDMREFERAIKTGAREFGGMGSTVTHVAEKAGVLSPTRKRGKGTSGFSGF